VTNDQDCDYSNPEVYPNPVGDLLVIDQENKQEMTCEVYSIEGELILRKTFYSNSLQINVSDLSRGIYVMRTFDKHQDRWVALSFFKI